MKKVVLRAPVLSQSGYGVHSRQVARWLLSRPDVELAIQPVQWGCTPWYIDPAAKGGFIGKLMSLTNAPPPGEKYDISFQVQLPNEWDHKLAGVNVGITAGVETDTCNPEWVSCVNKMSHVVFPSTFTRDVFKRSGQMTQSTCVIPESFIDAVMEDVPPLDISFSTSFNFLLVGQMTGRNADNDRKNIFNTVKWFCETFKDDADVGLVIKTNNGRDTKIDRKITSDILSQVLAQVRKGLYPRVHFVHGMMSDEEMMGLYRHPSVKAFLTLTRGEGFGLPILEAAAAGLPVIAPGWSGYTDFMSLGRYIKLDFDLHPVHPTRLDGKIFIPGTRWADVSEADVKRKLSKFRERSDVPQDWAKSLSILLKQRYSFEAVKAQYDKLFEGLVL